MSKKRELENVKIDRQVLEKVRMIKEYTGVSITAYVESAILEKAATFKKPSKK